MTKEFNKRNLSILFWGPIGKKGKSIIGGGESGNRRTIDMLNEKGITVIEIPKPYPNKKNKVSGLVYSLALLRSCMRFAYYCFQKINPIQIAHLSAFYSHLIYFEMIMLLFAKVSGIPFVYEIRGATMLTAYYKRSTIYKLFFDTVIRKSDAVFSQGVEYIDFIVKKTKKEPLYYPNYVDVKYLNRWSQNKRINSEEVCIIYFGRIVPSKDIIKAVRACKILKEKGIKYHLYIIGEGPKDYIDKVVNLTKVLGIEKTLSIQPPMVFKDLITVLLKMHFFIFPTLQEGHSNSLTEAMAFGVVPVCSNAGFNAFVVKKCGTVLSLDSKPRDYAKAIEDIWKNKMWGSLSKKCKERISKEFSSDVIVPRVIRKYNELANSRLK